MGGAVGLVGRVGPVGQVGLVGLVGQVRPVGRVGLVGQFFRASVLAVFAGVAAILDGEGGAVVEAGEAEVAVSGTPSGFAALDGDEVVGAEVGA